MEKATATMYVDNGAGVYILVRDGTDTIGYALAPGQTDDIIRDLYTCARLAVEDGLDAVVESWETDWSGGQIMTDWDIAMLMESCNAAHDRTDTVVEVTVTDETGGLIGRELLEIA